MQTEQPGRDGAFAYYRDQESIYRFHRRLREFYHFVKKYCDDIPEGECGETPKLVCLRSLREYPPVRCKLYDAGYFPLVIDYRFAKDIGRDSITPPIRVTDIHAKRFKDMCSDIETFRLVKVPGPDDLSKTMVNMKWREQEGSSA